MNATMTNSPDSALTPLPDIFKHEEFGTLQTVLIGDKPYFRATECAKMLGYADPYDAIARHTKGSVKRRVLSDGGEQDMKFIPEGDLYRLVIRSKLPTAQKFETWVFEDVLPTIRKHGIYLTTAKMEELINDPNTMIFTLQTLMKERDARQAAEAKIEADKPLVNFALAVGENAELITVAQMAKILCDENMPIGQNRLYAWLRNEQVLRGNNEPYQHYVDLGYFTMRTVCKQSAYGERFYPQTMITGKGQRFIVERLRRQYATEGVCDELEG